MRTALQPVVPGQSPSHRCPLSDSPAPPARTPLTQRDPSSHRAPPKRGPHTESPHTAPRRRTPSPLSESRQPNPPAAHPFGHFAEGVAEGRVLRAVHVGHGRPRRHQGRHTGPGRPASLPRGTPGAVVRARGMLGSAAPARGTLGNVVLPSRPVNIAAPPLCAHPMSNSVRTRVLETFYCGLSHSTKGLFFVVVFFCLKNVIFVKKGPRPAGCPKAAHSQGG